MPAKSATIVLFLLLASALPAAEGPARTDVRYAEHVARLRARLPANEFTIVIEKPFVVIGDEGPARVRMRARNTVRWATTMLKKDYFDKNPATIIDIWLFKDKESYRKHAKEFFGRAPTSPFGYCSHRHNALVMNIATGGGTLVHEMVHAFMEANFPECPTWFNEGLASLYEQCRQKSSHIHGLTNWRLAGLQKSIRAGKVPPFKTLALTTSHQFYNEDKGTNYAQARYLCYYLQEKELLRRYYREMIENHKADPTGHETLKAVLKEKDMDAFKKRWEEWVLTLKFR